MKQRSDGRWCKKVTINGKTNYFYSKAKTERAATADINNQLVAFHQKQENGKTFREVAEEWKEDQWKDLANNTLKQYRPATAQALEHFGDKFIKDIEARDVSLFIDKLAKRGYAFKTVKSRLLVTSLIFKYAVINGYIDNNPCLYIKVPSKLSKGKRESITEIETKAIINNVDKTFGDLALFLLYTGLRRGEAFALTPGDVDFENNIVNVNKTVEWLGNKPQIKPTPKTDAGIRSVPLPDVLISLLKPKMKQKYIFCDENGELMHSSQITRKWNKYRLETGIDASPHQLRHAYATMLFDAGIDVKTAQRYLGHTDIQTTLNIYTHLSEQRQSDSKKKLFDYIEQLN